MKPPAETDEYLKAMTRMIRAAGRRVAVENPEDLTALAGLHAVIDEALQHGIDGLRADGVTWQSIGDALGVTRQAALMRWGRDGHGAG